MLPQPPLNRPIRLVITWPQTMVRQAGTGKRRANNHKHLLPNKPGDERVGFVTFKEQSFFYTCFLPVCRFKLCSLTLFSMLLSTYYPPGVFKYIIHIIFDIYFFYSDICKERYSIQTSALRRRSSGMIILNICFGQVHYYNSISFTYMYISNILDISK